MHLHYQTGTKGYKVYDINNHKPFLSRDVTFHESIFSYHKIVTSSDFIHLPIVHETDNHQPANEQFSHANNYDGHFSCDMDLNVDSSTPSSFMDQLTIVKSNTLIRCSTRERSRPAWLNDLVSDVTQSNKDIAADRSIDSTYSS